MKVIFRIVRIRGMFSAASDIRHELQKKYRKMEITAHEIEQAMIRANIIVVASESKPVPFWIRLTIFPAIIFFMGLIVILPVHFLLTGRWGYSQYSWIKYWFQALGW